MVVEPRLWSEGSSGCTLPHRRGKTPRESLHSFQSRRLALTGSAAGGTARSVKRRASEFLAHPHGTAGTQRSNLLEIDPPLLAEAGRRLRASVSRGRAYGLDLHTKLVERPRRGFLSPNGALLLPCCDDFQECVAGDAAHPRVMTGWVGLKVKRLRSKV